MKKDTDWTKRQGPQYGTMLKNLAMPQCATCMIGRRGDPCEEKEHLGEERRVKGRKRLWSWEEYAVCFFIA